MTSMARIFSEIADERKRQDEKWGEQNHPSVEPDSVWAHLQRDRWEQACKIACDDAAEAGNLCWEHIADEELAEAYAAEDDAERRGELVQLAAVIVAWVECIDRRSGK